MFINRIVQLSLIAVIGGCARTYDPGELSPTVETGGIYYTQFSLFQEKNRYRTTNYRRGVLIPINTPVTLISIDSKRIVIQLTETGEQITIENVQKHTQEDTQQAFDKILGKRRVDLSRFSKEEQKSILSGVVKKGMSRKAVLAAIGYPPQSKTPSLDGSDWTYWRSHSDRFVVRFGGDKVVDIVN